MSMSGTRMQDANAFSIGENLVVSADSISLQYMESSEKGSCMCTI